MYKLKERCLAPIEDFYKEGLVTQTANGPFIYKDNGANILAVAHLDTVQSLRHFNVVRRKSTNQQVIYNAQLDDRLGAYLILDALPQRGIVVDVLLTTGEETGRSTARFFEKPEGKEYLWMFELDRAGTDVVSYQYEDAELNKRLRDAGFEVGIGSFTDISAMGKMGIKGVNFGVGYHDNHGPQSHMVVEETDRMFNLFCNFYWTYKDTPMPHDGSKDYHRSYGGYHFAWDDGDYAPSYRNTNWRANSSKETYRTVMRYSRNGKQVEVYRNGKKVWPPDTDKKCSICGGELYSPASIKLEVCSVCRHTVGKDRCKQCEAILRSTTEIISQLCDDCYFADQRCSVCDKPITSYREMEAGICWGCRAKTDNYVCANCGGVRIPTAGDDGMCADCLAEIDAPEPVTHCVSCDKALEGDEIRLGICVECQEWMTDQGGYGI